MVVFCGPNPYYLQPAELCTQYPFFPHSLHCRFLLVPCFMAFIRAQSWKPVLHNILRLFLPFWQEVRAYNDWLTGVMPGHWWSMSNIRVFFKLLRYFIFKTCTQTKCRFLVWFNLYWGRLLHLCSQYRVSFFLLTTWFYIMALIALWRYCCFEVNVVLMPVELCMVLLLFFMLSPMQCGRDVLLSVHVYVHVKSHLTNWERSTLIIIQSNPRSRITENFSMAYSKSEFFTSPTLSSSSSSVRMEE